MKIRLNRKSDCQFIIQKTQRNKKIILKSHKAWEPRRYPHRSHRSHFRKDHDIRGRLSSSLRLLSDSTPFPITACASLFTIMHLPGVMLIGIRQKLWRVVEDNHSSMPMR